MLLIYIVEYVGLTNVLPLPVNLEIDTLSTLGFYLDHFLRLRPSRFFRLVGWGLVLGLGGWDILQTTKLRLSLFGISFFGDLGLGLDLGLGTYPCQESLTLSFSFKNKKTEIISYF